MWTGQVRMVHCNGAGENEHLHDLVAVAFGIIHTARDSGFVTLRNVVAEHGPCNVPFCRYDEATMMNTTKKSTLKLPRLRTKEELLKTSPELFKKLLLADDLNSARSTSPSTTNTTKQTNRPQHSANGATKSLSRSATQNMNHYDSPRGFGDEPLTLDQELSIELESVKRERQSLLESISHVRAEAGSAGSEAQQADIRQLLKELELKKAKLNELKGQSRRADLQLSKLMDDNNDAVRLTPDEMLQEKAYIQSLEDEMAAIQRDLEEGDAKNRLYQLLLERTKREHMAVDQKVRDKQECKRNCLEDLAKLSDALGATRAAKEMSEKELAKVRRQVDEARSDWMKKIRERRMEVRDLKKNQQKEREKEVRKREKQLEKERAEREEAVKMKMEMEAYELQVAALAPKVEAMEAQWNRLRAISGAETPDDVIAYWDALRNKRQRMQDLVKLAERREAACKEEMTRLLNSRSTMLENSAVANATQAASAAAVAAARGSTAGAGAAARGSFSGASTQRTSSGGSSGGAADGDGNAAAVQAQIEATEKKMAACKAQFTRLHKVCVAADQGLRSLMKSLQVALGEPTSPTAATAAAAAGGGAAGSPGQVGGATAGRPQGPPSASAGSSQGAGDARRSQSGIPRDVRSPGSTGSASGRHPTATGKGGRDQQVPDSAGSKSARLKSTGPRGVTSASGSETTPASSAPAEEEANGLSTMTRPQLPSRGRNTIDDDSFFEELPQILNAVTSRLEKLLEAEDLVNFEDLKATMGNLLASEESGPSTARSGASGPSTQSSAVAAAAADVAAFTAAAAEAANAAAARAEEAAAAEAAAKAEADQARAGLEMEASTAEQAASEAQAAEGEGEASADGAAGAVAGGASEAALGASGEPSSSKDAAAVEASASGASEAPVGSEGPEEAPSVPSLRGMPSSVGSLMREKSGVPPAALAVGGEHSMAIPPSEKALMKGLYRRTWTGAPWLDTISANPLELSFVPTMKRRKGKRKEGTPQVDVSRILGYTAGDVDAESESEPSDDDEGSASGMVLDRDWIKMRAAKMLARHNAKQAAAAAAAAAMHG